MLHIADHALLDHLVRSVIELGIAALQTNLKDLLGLGRSECAKRVHLFRPGYIYPVVPRKEPNVFYRALRRIYPFARLVWPGVGIPSVDVARAMLTVGLDASLAGDEPAIERSEIRSIAQHEGSVAAP